MKRTSTLPRGRAHKFFEKMSDQELLSIRICNLDVSIQESALSSNVSLLFSELKSAGLKNFRPVVYLGDEWFSPEGLAAISIPFYLAHPRLKQLEKSIMHRVEGGTPAWCMKLLRHEAGHAFEQAFNLSQTRKWQELFGSPSLKYDPDHYEVHPYSKQYVKNLEDNYAQAHPEEDFAETFAVYVNPSSNWRVRYANRERVLEKLEYVDQMFHRYSERRTPTIAEALPFFAGRMRSTLSRYYERRIKAAGDDFTGFFDDDLKRIFNGPKGELAGQFLTSHKNTLVDTVSTFTGESRYTINNLVKRLKLRCEQIDLHLGKDDTRTTVEMSAWLSTMVTNYRNTGKFSRIDQ